MTDERKWPELSEELSRKALDVVHDCVHRYLVDKTMTKAELKAATDAVYNTITGLADWQAARLIEAVQKELDL